MQPKDTNGSQTQLGILAGTLTQYPQFILESPKDSHIPSFVVFGDLDTPFNTLEIWKYDIQSSSKTFRVVTRGK